MELREINSNTIKIICNDLTSSVNELGKSKNLDTFHKNYVIYNEAWVAWDTLMKMLESGNESEYKAYAYSLINKFNPVNKSTPVSFDPQIKTLQEFYDSQLKHSSFFPFSPNEIVAWDNEYFIIDDFLSPSVVILNRMDRLHKK